MGDVWLLVVVIVMGGVTYEAGRWSERRRQREHDASSDPSAGPGERGNSESGGGS